MPLFVTHPHRHRYSYHVSPAWRYADRRRHLAQSAGVLVTQVRAMIATPRNNADPAKTATIGAAATGRPGKVVRRSHAPPNHMPAATATATTAPRLKLPLAYRNA